MRKYRFTQFALATVSLLGTLLSSHMGGNQVAIAGDFVRRDADANNPFYEIIDDFQQFANTEANALDLSEVGAKELDPNKLSLVHDHEIKIFFINEGAGYRNQLGVIATGETNLETMVFDDITCTQDCSYTGYRSPYEIFGTPDGQPLEIGDYYTLGLIEKGSDLDFFLRRDGFERANTDIWHTDRNQNSDGLQHVIAYDFQNYLVLAWEDINGGGDLDYNDVVFAIDFGEANIKELKEVSPTQIPDSSVPVLGFAMVGAAGLSLSHKANQGSDTSDSPID
jgi:hypothetical protein